MNNLFTDAEKYTGDLRKFDEVLSFIPFFTDIDEDDYIIYYPDRKFQYTNRFNDFIKTLFEAGLVEDYQDMLGYLKDTSFDMEASGCYSAWVREMNRTICRPDLLNAAGLPFIRKAFLTLIRLEKVIPGSWGIDVEVGTWLKLLRRLSAIRSEMAA